MLSNLEDRINLQSKNEYVDEIIFIWENYD